MPGLNVPYGVQFKGIRQVVGPGGRPDTGPGWREMGKKNDKRFCYASLPGAGGKEFMGQVGGKEYFLSVVVVFCGRESRARRNTASFCCPSFSKLARLLAVASVCLLLEAVGWWVATVRLEDSESSSGLW